MNERPPPSRDELIGLILRRVLVEARFALTNLIEHGEAPYKASYVRDQINAALEMDKLEYAQLYDLALAVHALPG